MHPSELWRRHPTLFHMAACGSWPNIRRHGLLSTIALLDLFEVVDDQLERLTAERRLANETLMHPVHGVAVIRDQIPLNDRKLAACLRGISVPDWYRLLNGRVFFWTDRKRLDGLLDAKAYRGNRQTVITIDTRSLVERHQHRIRLAPINTGATYYKPALRGQYTFAPIAEFAAREVVEVTIDRALPDVAEHVVHVQEIGGDQQPTMLWTRTESDPSEP